MTRTVATLTDTHLGRPIKVAGWSGCLIAITPCAGRYRLRIALDGGADLLTGWLDADEEVEVGAREGAGR